MPPDIDYIDDDVMAILRSGVPADEEPTAPKHSEEALALAFTAQYGDDLRYVAAWGKWLAWDGQRWRIDDTLAVYDRARAICRAAAASADPDQKAAVRIAQAKTVAAVEHLARSDRRHAATVDQWDADDWLLNTPSGVVNLRTVVIRSGLRDDHMTKITAVGPGGDCPMWRAFLDRITDGNEDLQLFLQRVCGYCLTGSTGEHALFFLYGTGANGKSVFVRTIGGILADYAKTAPVETFVVTYTDRHPTDVAMLHGARMVAATETEASQKWAEAKIKNLTGGDPIAARFMRCDFFTFVPRFKLIVSGNHKPSLHSVDEAVRRRLHLIPFTVTIPLEERDKELVERLRPEWSGILSWMLDGCRNWQEQGLKPPDVVRDATAAYFEAEDSIQRFLGERCDLDSSACSSSSALFKDWNEWCEQNNEHPGSQRRFSQMLESHGFKSERSRKARGFKGLALKVDHQ